MKTVIVKDKSELLRYKEDILNLFLESYGQELSGDLWEWAYIDNPFGNPYVALAFDGGLIAHYAVIPYPLVDEAGVKQKSFLSMTTMVAKSHRKFGLFAKLASLVYGELKKDGADFVMGFPNRMSAPGFRKRLGWEVLEPDVVVSVTWPYLEKLADIESKITFDRESRLLANLSDVELCDWRLSKPGANYIWRDGVAYKEYNGEIDVIYYKSQEALKNLPAAPAYNLILPATIVNDHDFVSFEYVFGGLGLNKDFNPSIVRRQMCLSDVF